MLEHLFGSKARLQLLRVFLHHPNRAYYVRELTRLTDLQINAVRRELNNLESIQLVVQGEATESTGDTAEPSASPKKKQTKADKKYYQINTEHTLFEELRQLIMKAEVLVESDLGQQIAKLGRVKYIALTGVFVGNTHANTDILIVGTMGKEKLKTLIRKYEKQLGREVNFTILTPQEFRYRRDITDRFLIGILEGKKIVALDELDS